MKTKQHIARLGFALLALAAAGCASTNHGASESPVPRGHGLASPEKPAYTVSEKAEMMKIENCLECGACKKRCPYELDIPRLLKKKLESNGDRFELVYTRNEEGRKALLECRRAANEGRIKAKVTRARTI